jgi:hypothetical protein
MQFYDVSFKAAVSPDRGELIIPFREVVVRKLNRTAGSFATAGEITCRRFRDFVAAHLDNVVFFAQLGPVDSARKTLPVDALITFAFILLEITDVGFFQTTSTDEFVMDQSFLRLATGSAIRLDQFEDFDHFNLQQVRTDEVPRIVLVNHHNISEPLYFHVW